jgi:hypothetical protein
MARLASSGFAIVVMCLANTGSAAVHKDQPLQGLAYNTKEMSALIYECGVAQADRMTCKFTQMAVRKKTTAEEIKKRLADFDKLPEKERTPDPKLCAEMTKGLDILEGRRKPDEPMRLKDPRDIANAKKAARAILKTCETGDLAVMRKELADQYALEGRTCRVSAYNYEQTFKRVSDTTTGKFAWVVDEGGPTGECGIVNLSRFERASLKESSLVVWNYIARKAITNPSAKTMMGMKCSDFDESTYTYLWRSDESPSWAECDKVEFFVF